uniref:Uncharacterized protein n=1 Tax=Oryza punctata TaxID=4537 RepID=A0A0E0JJX6_ORYPU
MKEEGGDVDFARFFEQNGTMSVSMERGLGEWEQEEENTGSRAGRAAQVGGRRREGCRGRGRGLRRGWGGGESGRARRAALGRRRGSGRLRATAWCELDTRVASRGRKEDRTASGGSATLGKEGRDDDGEVVGVVLSNLGSTMPWRILPDFSW